MLYYNLSEILSITPIKGSLYPMIKKIIVPFILLVITSQVVWSSETKTAMCLVRDGQTGIPDTNKPSFVNVDDNPLKKYKLQLVSDDIMLGSDKTKIDKTKMKPDTLYLQDINGYIAYSVIPPQDHDFILMSQSPLKSPPELKNPSYILAPEGLYYVADIKEPLSQRNLVKGSDDPKKIKDLWLNLHGKDLGAERLEPKPELISEQQQKNITSLTGHVPPQNPVTDQLIQIQDSPGNNNGFPYYFNNFFNVTPHAPEPFTIENLTLLKEKILTYTQSKHHTFPYSHEVYAYYAISADSYEAAEPQCTPEIFEGLRSKLGPGSKSFSCEVVLHEESDSAHHTNMHWSGYKKDCTPHTTASSSGH